MAHGILPRQTIEDRSGAGDRLGRVGRGGGQLQPRASTFASATSAHRIRASVSSGGAYRSRTRWSDVRLHTNRTLTDGGGAREPMRLTRAPHGAGRPPADVSPPTNPNSSTGRLRHLPPAGSPTGPAASTRRSAGYSGSARGRDQSAHVPVLRARRARAFRRIRFPPARAMHACHRSSPALPRPAAIAVAARAKSRMAQRVDRPASRPRPGRLPANGTPALIRFRRPRCPPHVRLLWTHRRPRGAAHPRSRRVLHPMSREAVTIPAGPTPPRLSLSTRSSASSASTMPASSDPGFGQRRRLPRRPRGALAGGAVSSSSHGQVVARPRTERWLKIQDLVVGSKPLVQTIQAQT